MKRVVYLAGPIRGIDNYKERFAKASAFLRDAGFVVLNPVETANGHMDHPPEWYMALDFDYIRSADEVVFMPGWRKSAGCKAEAVYAQSIGKPMAEYRAGHFYPVVLNLLATELVEGK